MPRFSLMHLFMFSCVSIAGVIAQPLAARDGAAVYQQECASCHDGKPTHAPNRAALQTLRPARIVKSLESGVMRVVGTFKLDGPERIAVAEHLTGKPYDPNWISETVSRCETGTWPSADLFAAPHWNGWGNGTHNRRYQSAAAAKLTIADVQSLELQWAFAFPGETIAESQPTIVDGRLFVGSRSGRVYALDPKTACQHWHYDAEAPVKNSVIVSRTTIDGQRRVLVLFGDLTGTAYAIDAVNGSLVWRRRVDPFPSSRLMGSFLVVGEEVFVPVTAMESTTAAATDAVCCIFRGSVVALDIRTGEERWRRYTIDEEPRQTGINKQGNPMFGPAGATIWSAPTFDPQHDVLYVGTGENSAHPATDTSDAILAIDINTTRLRWQYQGHAADAWNMSCGTADQTNCPADAGPDYDFGSSPSLADLGDGRRVLIAAQKSGVVHALDPDNDGKLLWQRKVAEGGVLGGIEWGPANDGEKVYVAVADMRWNTDDLLAADLGMNRTAGGGVVALNLEDGRIVWQAPAIDCGSRPQCSPAQTAAVTAIPNVVFAGGISGHMRAFNADNGEVIWTYDTVREYQTVNGARGYGGAIDATGAVVVDGWVYVTSGYSKWGGLPGNVLLAFAPARR